MGSTNKTSNYELSQFLGSDSPKWLTDYNADMQKIDAGIAAVKTQADATDLTVAGHTSTISNLGNTVEDQTTAIQQIRGDVTGLTGTVNTITSLIGNGEPTTTDKTLIGAINELNAKMPSAADDVSYSGTSSGLSATSVQDAIDNIVIYSSTEHAVGKWINGDTVYEKSYSIGAISSSTVFDNTLTNSNAKLISVQAMCSKPGDIETPFTLYGATGALVGQDLSLTGNGATISIFGSNAINSARITLRYIKVTP